MSVTRKRSGSASSMMLDLTLQNYSQSHISSQGGADMSNSVVYFVLPKGQTEETCSRALMSAYRVCWTMETILLLKELPDRTILSIINQYSVDIQLFVALH